LKLRTTAQMNSVCLILSATNQMPFDIPSCQHNNKLYVMELNFAGILHQI